MKKRIISALAAIFCSTQLSKLNQHEDQHCDGQDAHDGNCDCLILGDDCGEAAVGILLCNITATVDSAIIANKVKNVAACRACSSGTAGSRAS